MTRVETHREIGTSISVARVKSEPVTVLVDGMNFKSEQAGVRTYVLGLVRALAAEGGIRLIVASSLPEEFARTGVETLTVPTFTQKPIARAVWRELSLDRIARAVNADVLLSPVTELPMRRMSVPTVVVIHDIGATVAPHLYGRKRQARQVVAVSRICRVASRLVCVSESTSRRLVQTKGVDPARCRVIGEGSPSFARSRDSRDLQHFLYVGTLHKHKNVDTLIRGFAQARGRLTVDLLCVGPASASELRAFERLCRETGVAERVRHLGFVSPEQLHELYRGAVAVVLPSLFEGFGLTALEALSNRIPLVASDIDAVSELAGNSAVYVDDPHSPGLWAEALVRISEDQELQRRLAEEGASRVRLRTWDRVGAQFAALLREAAGAS